MIDVGGANYESERFCFLSFTHFYVYILPVYMNPSCVPGAYRGQKRALDSLEQELQMVVSHHMGTED